MKNKCLTIVCNGQIMLIGLSVLFCPPEVMFLIDWQYSQSSSQTPQMRNVSVDSDIIPMLHYGCDFWAASHHLSPIAKHYLCLHCVGLMMLGWGLSLQVKTASGEFMSSGPTHQTLMALIWNQLLASPFNMTFSSSSQNPCSAVTHTLPAMGHCLARKCAQVFILLLCLQFILCVYFPSFAFALFPVMTSPIEFFPFVRVNCRGNQTSQIAQSHSTLLPRRKTAMQETTHGFLKIKSLLFPTPQRLILVKCCSEGSFAESTI